MKHERTGSTVTDCCRFVQHSALGVGAVKRTTLLNEYNEGRDVEHAQAEVCQAGMPEYALYFHFSRYLRARYHRMVYARGARGTPLPALLIPGAQDQHRCPLGKADGPNPTTQKEKQDKRVM